MSTKAASAFISMIERVALDPSADISKITQLYELRNAEISRDAELAFDEAMNAAQAEMKPVRAEAENEHTRSKYASYAALDNAIRPIYTRRGFAISFNTGDSAKPEHVKVLAYVTNGGHKRTYEFDMPTDSKAGLVDELTKAQATGGAASYGMRYLLRMIFNIAVGERDRDGNAQYERISKRQVTELRKLITKAKADEAALLTYLRVTALEDLPADEYVHTARTIRAKGERKPAGTGQRS